MLLLWSDLCKESLFTFCCSVLSIRKHCGYYGHWGFYFCQPPICPICMACLQPSLKTDTCSPTRSGIHEQTHIHTNKQPCDTIYRNTTTPDRLVVNLTLRTSTQRSRNVLANCTLCGSLSNLVVNPVQRKCLQPTTFNWWLNLGKMVLVWFTSFIWCGGSCTFPLLSTWVQTFRKNSIRPRNRFLMALVWKHYSGKTPVKQWIKKHFRKLERIRFPMSWLAVEKQSNTESQVKKRKIDTATTDFVQLSTADVQLVKSGRHMRDQASLVQPTDWTTKVCLSDQIELSPNHVGDLSLETALQVRCMVCKFSSSRPLLCG